MIKKSLMAIHRPVRFWLWSILLLSLIVQPEPVWACSCMMPDSPSSQFAQANAVFTGQITRLTDKQNPITSLLNQIGSWIGLPFYGYNSPGYGYQVNVNVNTAWKGITTPTTQVTTGYGDADCGYRFVVGAHYLIYAHGSSNNLQANICSRTAPLAQAAADLSYLSTLPALPLISVPQTSWVLIGASGFVLAVSLTGVVIFWLLRRRRRAAV